MSETQNQDVQSAETTQKSTQTETKPVILNFQMSLDNVNYLISILGSRPFNEVAQLITIIRSQAIQQLQATEEKSQSTVQ